MAGHCRPGPPVVPAAPVWNQVERSLFGSAERFETARRALGISPHPESSQACAHVWDDSRRSCDASRLMPADVGAVGVAAGCAAGAVPAAQARRSSACSV